VSEDIDHPIDTLRLARVDAPDTAPSDARSDNAAVGEAICVEFAGIFRCAGDLGAAVDAGCRGADIGTHGFARLVFSHSRPRRNACRRCGVSTVPECRQPNRALQDATAGGATFSNLRASETSV